MKEFMSNIFRVFIPGGKQLMTIELEKERRKS